MLSNFLIENGQLYNMFRALNRPSVGNEVGPADHGVIPANTCVQGFDCINFAGRYCSIKNISQLTILKVGNFRYFESLFN